MTSATVTTAAVTGLPGFETIEIVLEEETLTVALADTPARQSQGLMGVTDLGGLDGMVFIFPDSAVRRFWMKDTLIPLDIAFFATDGSLLGVLTMEPCEEDPCPTYGLDGPSQWALEARAGALQDLAPDATLDVLRDPFLPLISE